LNNNRNNRRRGRGNRNPNGNGNQLNRIDSRARGNAPQLLDKYKKLAQDAQHNGDRVQMEYYLQFADHYFRVIADNKARADEQRGGRRQDERDHNVEDFGEDDLDFDRGRRSDRVQRPRFEDQDNDPVAVVDEGEYGQEGEPFLAVDPRHDRNDEPRPRQQNARRSPRKPREENGAARADRGEAGDDARASAPRGEKPVRARKPRKSADADSGAIDSAILPPSIRGDDPGSGESGGTLETVE
jgi:hypothetical protein